jgi:outer membrane lipoprotein-sorting protein
MMMSRAVPLVLLLGALVYYSSTSTPARAADDAAALAAAMKDATATLQSGLKASEREGTPISAKFELEDGKLQLSVYTIKGDAFMEVVADPKTGAIAKAEKITDADDLKAATSQKAAMSKAKLSLLGATDKAVSADTGFRAVSVYPQLQNSRPVAEVTLLQGTTFKKLTEQLD